MSDITWQFQAMIPGGPAILIATPDITVGAYDVASATIADKAVVDVVVQPSSTKGDVVFVVVQSDVYGDALTYTIDGATTTTLDAPHVMLGAGAVGLMNGGAPPQTLTFTNKLGKDATIQVIAGRKKP